MYKQNKRWIQNRNRVFYEIKWKNARNIRGGGGGGIYLKKVKNKNKRRYFRDKDTDELKSSLHLHQRLSLLLNALEKSLDVIFVPF